MIILKSKNKTAQSCELRKKDSRVEISKSKELKRAQPRNKIRNQLKESIDEKVLIKTFWCFRSKIRILKIIQEIETFIYNYQEKRILKRYLLYSCR